MQRTSSCHQGFCFLTRDPCWRNAFSSLHPYCSAHYRSAPWKQKGSQHSLMQAKNRAKGSLPLPEGSFTSAKQARETDASACNSPRTDLSLSSLLLILPLKLQPLGKRIPDQPLWASRLSLSTQGVKARKIGGGTRASLANASKETPARSLCLPEREPEESAHTGGTGRCWYVGLI